MNELEEFLNWLKINYNKKTTIDRYFNTAKRLWEFSKGNITQADIDQFFLYMSYENNSQSTKNVTRATIMAWNEFKRTNFILPKYRRAESKGSTNNFISFQELTSITAQFPYIFEKSHAKKKLMFEFMFFTGLRASEVSNLKKSDIDFRLKRVNVTETKGKVDRFVPLFRPTMNQRLEIYMQTIRDNDDTLFGSTYGTLVDNFKIVKEQLMLSYDFTPLTMRHSFAMYCRRDLGLSIDIIQKLMGHKKITTTQIYCGVTEDMINEAFKNIKV